MWPQRGKIEILEKKLSLTVPNHFTDLEDTCRDKVKTVGVIVRYTKKVIEKKNVGWGHIWPPGARLSVNLEDSSHVSRSALD